jgi:hypothetical protein
MRARAATVCFAPVMQIAAIHICLPWRRQTCYKSKRMLQILEYSKILWTSLGGIYKALKGSREKRCDEACI